VLAFLFMALLYHKICICQYIFYDFFATKKPRLVSLIPTSQRLSAFILYFLSICFTLPSESTMVSTAFCTALTACLTASASILPSVRMYIRTEAQDMAAPKQLAMMLWSSPRRATAAPMVVPAAAARNLRDRNFFRMSIAFSFLF